MARRRRSAAPVRREMLRRRALMIEQPPQERLYVFALSASEVLEIAEISRVGRGEAGELLGYQRPTVRRHVDNIVDYLNSDTPLFPHALILALPSTVDFTMGRGPRNDQDLAVAGHLSIPLPRPGEPKPAWIVDGQQRALALAKCSKPDLRIPVTAFIADTVDVQRNQFVLLNTTRRLPPGLVTELLPEVSVPISPYLSARKLPAELCDYLNRTPSSPFYQLIRRASTPEAERGSAVVADNSLVRALEGNLREGGCLFPYRDLATETSDTEAIWALLLVWWGGVKASFREAWGKPADKSRLMHGVGIRAMGRLMDTVMAPTNQSRPRTAEDVSRELSVLVPLCRWTDGLWEELNGRPWNELQNLPSHISLLSNYLVRAYVRERTGAR